MSTPTEKSGIIFREYSSQRVEEALVVTTDIGDKLTVSPHHPRGLRAAWKVLRGRYQPKIIVYQKEYPVDGLFLHPGRKAPPLGWHPRHEPITRETVEQYLKRPDEPVKVRGKTAHDLKENDARTN